MADTDLLTLDEAIQAVSGTGSFAQHGEDLSLMVSAVSEAIDRWVGPVVIRTITDEIHDAPAGRIELKYRPVVSVSSVTEYLSGTGTVLTAESVSASGGYLVRDHFLARRSGFYTTGWNGVIKVTYTAGRFSSTSTVEARFKMAAKAVLTGAWAKYSAAWARGGDPFGDPTGGGSGFFDEFTPVVRRWLQADRLPPAVA